MRVRVIAFAVPLAVGMACTTSGSQARGSGSTPTASSGTQGSDTTSTTAQGSTTSSGQGSQASSGAQGAQGALDPLMEPGPAIKGHASDQIVAGEIGDVSSDTVSIQSVQGDTTTLEIVPQTSIKIDGRDATYAELEEGQQVRASFNQVEGRDVAVEIDVGRSPSDAASGSSGSAQGAGSPDLGSSGSSGGSSPDTSSTPGGSPDASRPSDTRGAY